MIPSAGKHAEQREARDLEARTVRQDPPSRDRGSGLCAPSRGAGMFTTPSRSHPPADEQRAVQTQRWKHGVSLRAQQRRQHPSRQVHRRGASCPAGRLGGVLGEERGCWVRLALARAVSTPLRPAHRRLPSQSGRAQAPLFSASVVCSSEAAMEQRGRRRSP